MGNLTSLNLSTRPSSGLAVGGDVTLLLAAASFITKFDNKADPRATEAFIAVTSAYCNGSDLILPLPRQDVERVPVFYDLWQGRAALKRVPDVELSDEAFESIAEKGATDFALYAEGEAWNVGRWISFQFTPNISGPYLQRADHHAVRRCGPVAKKLLKNGQLNELQKVISVLVRDNSISAPWIYENLVGTDDVPSLLHLCISYAVSVSLRGYSNAIALSQHENAPLYRHHWVRSPIVRRIPVDIPANVEERTMLQFPWGEILQRVFDPTAPLLDRSPTKVKEVLDGLRDSKDQVLNAIQQGLLNNLIDEHTPNRITDAETFILDLLIKVGVSPRYASSNFLKKSVGLLRKISEQSHLFKMPVELITANLQPMWLRMPESVARMRFKRDSFWSVMGDPGIRDALRRISTDIPS